MRHNNQVPCPKPGMISPDDHLLKSWHDNSLGEGNENHLNLLEHHDDPSLWIHFHISRVLTTLNHLHQQNQQWQQQTRRAIPRLPPTDQTCNSFLHVFRIHEDADWITKYNLARKEEDRIRLIRMIHWLLLLLLVFGFWMTFRMLLYTLNSLPSLSIFSSDLFIFICRLHSASSLLPSGRNSVSILNC